MTTFDGFVHHFATQIVTNHLVTILLGAEYNDYVV